MVVHPAYIMAPITVAYHGQVEPIFANAMTFCNTVMYSLISACAACQLGASCFLYLLRKQHTHSPRSLSLWRIGPCSGILPPPHRAMILYVCWLGLVAAPVIVAQLDTAPLPGPDLATCTNSQYYWVSARLVSPLAQHFNSLGQSPCDAVIDLYTRCNDYGFVGDDMFSVTAGESYPPLPANSSECFCNTVWYCLTSACAACQNGTWHSYVRFILALQESQTHRIHQMAVLLTKLQQNIFNAVGSIVIKAALLKEIFRYLRPVPSANRIPK